MEPVVQDRAKTRQQLICELRSLRVRVAELEDDRNAPPGHRTPHDGTDAIPPTEDDGISDVQRQRKAQTLRENDERFRAVVEQAGDSMFLLTLDGHFVDANRVACERLGYRRAELLSLTIHDVDPDAVSSADRAGFWPAVMAGKTATFEARHRHKNGTMIPVEVTLGLIQLRDERLLLCLVRDITERLRAQETLRDSEAFLRATFDAIQDGVNVLDPALNIIRVNAWLKAMYTERMPLVGRKLLRGVSGSRHTLPGLSEPASPG